MIAFLFLEKKNVYIGEVHRKIYFFFLKTTLYILLNESACLIYQNLNCVTIIKYCYNGVEVLKGTKLWDNIIRSSVVPFVYRSSYIYVRVIAYLKWMKYFSKY